MLFQTQMYDQPQEIVKVLIKQHMQAMFSINKENS